MNQLIELVQAQYPRYLLRVLMLSVLEVAAVALLFILTKPYFESYQVFWYLLCLIIVPACACTVAVNGLTKIASQVMVQAQKRNIEIANTGNKKLATSAWQYVAWYKLLIMLVTAFIIALCYSASAQSFTDLLLLFLAMIIATFIFASWLIINAAVPLSQAVLQAFRHRKKPYNEAQSSDHIIRFHLLPWSLIAVATLFTFFVKYYLGLADEDGYVETSSLIGSTYISAAFVALWLWLEVGQMARLDHILGHIHLTGVGHVTDSQAFSLVMAVPIILVVSIAVFNNILDIEQYRYQAAIALSMLCILLAALSGASIAVIQLCASKTVRDVLADNT
ncbi:hypothetical protein PSECIP111951_00436 [Pseudoalteromonas holothuriae]|uniref:Uncharacterized protein n=1 Tax=Pseudoalteromonas holothuriae TaxID=2963714 RepID=A0A9W4QR34_9GAMM|nr:MULTISPECIES: hypothetical protein [unclassified Pseudoalteromonas]CAH9049684.1 hypothetical protein PSECIP111854_00331 [Pseudoalteromonas sp. CIP111854]CAH9051641.1 hypothetical protein PSECIP111951_00436 [Pseudoalteromonas sp. CIP111951]